MTIVVDKFAAERYVNVDEWRFIICLSNHNIRRNQIHAYTISVANNNCFVVCNIR